MRAWVTILLLSLFIPATCLGWGIVSVSGFGTTGPVLYDGADNASTTDAIPDMTSNTAPSGFASAYQETNPAWHAFDNDLGTAYLKVNPLATKWLKYQFTSAKLINKYKLTPGSTNYMCSAWTLEGSNNGSSWTELDSRTGVTSWTTDVAKTYTFVVEGTQTYTFFRLNITATVGGTHVSVEEMELIVQAI